MSAVGAATDPVLECNFFDEDWEYDDGRSGAPPRAPAGVLRPAAPQPSAWRRQIAEILKSRNITRSTDAWPTQREILYVVDVPSSLARGGLILSLYSRDRRADGSWKPERALSLKREQFARLPLLGDREILSALAWAKLNYGYGSFDSYEPLPESFLIPHDLAGMIMPQVTRAGRCPLADQVQRHFQEATCPASATVATLRCV